MIYHILTEAEPLSEHTGGAIARWVANVMVPERETAICPGADRSYRLPEKSVRISQGLALLGRWKRSGRFSAWAQEALPGLEDALARRVCASWVGLFRQGDIAWVHNRPLFACALQEFLKGTGAAVVLHMHNSHLQGCSAKHIDQLREIPIAFCSQFLYEEALPLFRGETASRYVVYNGACETRFYPRQEERNGRTRVTFVGRLVPEKGAHVLVEAMRLLKSSGVQTSCSLVGGAAFGTTVTTPYVQRLREMMPSNCQMEGYLTGEQLAAHLRQTDVFCCPSVWQEPFGMTNLEAMASGVPVVASNVGGIPEVLRYGGGVLVGPNNVDALADALGGMILDRPYRLKMGREARAAFQAHFTWSRIRERYHSIMREVAQ
jgi:spore coat protein SA